MKIKLTKFQRAELEYRLANSLPDLGIPSEEFYHIQGQYLVCNIAGQTVAAINEVNNLIACYSDAIDDLYGSERTALKKHLVALDNLLSTIKSSWYDETHTIIVLREVYDAK